MIGNAIFKKFVPGRKIRATFRYFTQSFPNLQGYSNLSSVYA